MYMKYLPTSGICLYMFEVNVGKYSMHGACGRVTYLFPFLCAKHCQAVLLKSLTAEAAQRVTWSSCEFLPLVVMAGKCRKLWIWLGNWMILNIPKCFRKSKIMTWIEMEAVPASHVWRHKWFLSMPWLPWTCSSQNPMILVGLGWCPGWTNKPCRWFQTSKGRLEVSWCPVGTSKSSKWVVFMGKAPYFPRKRWFGQKKSP